MATAKKTKPYPSGIHTITASKVIPKNIEWLWPGFIMRGAITNLVGDPGVGKGILWTDIVGKLTSGALLPVTMKTTISPVSVVVIASEDNLNFAARPRLEAAGADLRKVEFYTGFTRRGRDKTFDIKYTGALERLIRRHHASLVIVDPVFDFMGDTKINHSEEVKNKLLPLLQLAEKLNVAIVNVIHANKTDTKAIYKTMGSITFVGKARTEIFLAENPDNEKQVLVALKKNNYWPKMEPLCFEVHHVGPHDQSIKVVWQYGAGKGWTADKLLANVKGNSVTKLDKAKIALEAILATGPRPTVEVHSVITDRFGIGEDTIKAARKHLGVLAEQKPGQTGHWLQLPRGSHSANPAP